jgi:DNA mismatch repair ATPase MutS
VVQSAFLWDVHVLDAVEGWQREVGPHVRGWLAALGTGEALAALASLAHDQPTWVFPDLAPEAPALVGTGLGHPLLPDSTRVGNDVDLGPPGTFLLVTGSNMSGKSTLLRAIGANAVLAQAGGPVCAGSLSLPPLRVWTSMRVQDSLAAGVSFFMAELLRLRDVVRAADAAGSPVLYLLDEILQGTNTAERQIAARRVILHLLRQGAIGAVSTHDLSLVAADAPPALVAAARQVHFRETVLDTAEGPRMTFDYTLRPGTATSTNALRLMQIVGLDA